MEKTFAVAGISTLEGDTKVRFAKDLTRVKVLEKNGHTGIKLVELPTPMDKLGAVAYLLTNSQFKDEASQAVLKAYGTDKPKKAVKETDTEEAPERDGVEVDASALVNKVKTPDEVAEIRAKNLKTLKEVHARMKAEGKIEG